MEVPGTFKGLAMQGIPVGPLPEPIASLVRTHAEQQSLTVDAGLGNSPEKVIKAMLHDPMNKFVEDDDRIEDLAWNMLYHEREWLPREWQEWIPKKEDIARRRHWVDEKELAGRDNARVCKYPVDPKVKAKAFFARPL